jgi:hypothetical protein
MHHSKIKFNRTFFCSKHICVILSMIGLLTVFFMFSFKLETLSSVSKTRHLTKKDSISSKKAFLKVYAVLMSPRCMNCHPSGDIPLQGDDSHLHSQGVKRGPDGRGLYALKCGNCHQFHNLPGLHMPPGNPNWRLPPSTMKMVFQGKSPGQLATQLLDKKRNGGKSVKALIKHITSDSLVLSGWTPADGLAHPPLSHQEFVAAFNERINKGAVNP